MKQAEISVLNGLYKNAAVGKDAIFCVLEHTQDPDLRKELCTQLDYYETQQQKIRQQMKTFYQKNWVRSQRFVAVPAFACTVWAVQTTTKSQN